MLHLSHPARWALAALSLSMLMPSLDTSIANVALPTLADAFAAPFADVQWVVLAYLLAITTLIVSVGRLGDLMGRKRMLLAGIGLFTLASLMCGAATSMGSLFAARGAQGLGAAIMLALTIAFIGETVPPARTGSAMGILGTMSAIGTTLGPSIGGVLIAGFGWRTIFLVNVPLGILNFILAARYLPGDKLASKARGAAFDVPGTLLLALTLAAYALATTIGHRQLGPLNVALLAAAALGALLFVHVEKRAAAPLVQLAIFRDPALGGGLVLSALVATVLMATLVVGPFYLARAFGLSAATVGFVLSVGPLVAALTGVPAGRIVDRNGAARMTIAGLLAIASGSAALALMPLTLGLAGYLAPIAIITAGYALFQTANNTAVMSGIHSEQRGVISGMLNLARNLGLITGTSIMGAVFVASGFRATFVLAALLVLGAAAIAILRATQNSQLTTTIPDSDSPPAAA